MIYVTYKDNGIPKKGVLSEQKLASLEKDALITDIISYNTDREMENSYKSLLGENNNYQNKKLLKD